MYIIVNEKLRKRVRVKNKEVEKLLLELGFNPATCVVVQNGKILTDKDEIEENKEVYIYTTASHG